MPSLRELQRDFVAGVLEDSSRVLAAIAPRGLDPSRRLNIYRNNAREGFLKTLEATFPVVLQLAGADWFRQTGTDYWRAHPSRAGNLHWVGERFADFLMYRLAGSPYEYFADVARLEWAYQEVLVAADHPAFDIAALASVEPQQYASLRFVAHPALRLVRSRFPLLAIWQANRSDASRNDTIDLDAGGAHVLIVRRDDHVELRDIDAGDFALLYSLARDEPLEAALDTALSAAPTLDFGASLARLVQLGCFVDFSVAARD